MVDVRWIAKNLEESGRGLFEVLPRNFPALSEENNKNLSVQSMF
jgi:hypothetical protein